MSKWEKKKHDTIEGVWTDFNKDKLVDCSAVEAGCYNAGYKAGKSTLQEYAGEIEKKKDLILKANKTALKDIGLYWELVAEFKEFFHKVNKQFGVEEGKK